MIEHVYRRAKACSAIADVIVATDDQRIADAVHAFGGQARMTSARHESGTDRLAEVAPTVECDLVVNVQGDEPLIEPAAIEQVLRPFSAQPSLVMTTLRTPLSDQEDSASPHVVKVVVDRDGFALYFSRALIPYSRSRALGPGAFKHIGLYAYRREFLSTFSALPRTPLERTEALEQLRVLEHGYRILTVETAYDSIGVDTPQDLERVRRLLGDAAHG